MITKNNKEYRACVCVSKCSVSSLSRFDDEKYQPKRATTFNVSTSRWNTPGHRGDGGYQRETERKNVLILSSEPCSLTETSFHIFSFFFFFLLSVFPSLDLHHDSMPNERAPCQPNRYVNNNVSRHEKFAWRENESKETENFLFPSSFSTHSNSLVKR